MWKRDMIEDRIFASWTLPDKYTWGDMYQLCDAIGQLTYSELSELARHYGVELRGRKDKIAEQIAQIVLCEWYRRRYDGNGPKA